MAIYPYPTHLISTWQLADGRNITIRPIRPEDAEIEQAFVRGLSEEARYFRFMFSVQELSQTMLLRFTQIDYSREMALIAVTFEQDKEIELGVAITPLESRGHFERIAPLGALLLPVDGSSIGECLSQVMQAMLQDGYSKVLALNSDGPSLPKEYIRQAVKLLDHHDLVFGPGMDGGYYLVGMKRFHPGIFRGIAWSTNRVLDQTLSQAASLGLFTSMT